MVKVRLILVVLKLLFIYCGLSCILLMLLLCVVLLVFIGVLL